MQAEALEQTGSVTHEEVREEAAETHVTDPVGNEQLVKSLKAQIEELKGTLAASQNAGMAVPKTLTAAKCPPPPQPKHQFCIW